MIPSGMWPRKSGAGEARIWLEPMAAKVQSGVEGNAVMPIQPAAHTLHFIWVCLPCGDGISVATLAAASVAASVTAAASCCMPW